MSILGGRMLAPVPDPESGPEAVPHAMYLDLLLGILNAQERQARALEALLAIARKASQEGK